MVQSYHDHEYCPDYAQACTRAAGHGADRRNCNAVHMCPDAMDLRMSQLMGQGEAKQHLISKLFLACRRLSKMQS